MLRYTVPGRNQIIIAINGTLHWMISFQFIVSYNCLKQSACDWFFSVHFITMKYINISWPPIIGDAESVETPSSKWAGETVESQFAFRESSNFAVLQKF